MKYRIKIKTTLGGYNRYYIQKRVLWIFWVYVYETFSHWMSMSEFERIYYSSLEAAEEHIKNLIRIDNINKNKKIVSTKNTLK